MTYLLALSAGLLLFASDHPLHLWWLGLLAFVPFWVALAKARRDARRLWPIGLIFALANALPITISAGPSTPILAAAVANVVQWPLAAMLAGRVLLRGPVLGPLAAAGAVTLTELLIWYAVPIFGTAQCCARPLSAAPAMVAFVAFTGLGGLVFALLAVQAALSHALLSHALLSRALLNRRARAASLGTAAAVVVLVTIADLVRWHRPLGAPVSVAACGWTSGSDKGTDVRAFFDGTLARAGASGADLVVTPEVGVYVGASGWAWPDEADALQFFAERARRHGFALALGVWDSRSRDNRIWFFDATGERVGIYRKTHLIPWFETYRAGDGTLVTASAADGTEFGGMICQDDNFVDLARGFGRRGVPLVAVPTNDWASIREYHLENGIFRAIENGYAVVRAASNGISALVSPRGEVLARNDHLVEGAGEVAAELPTGDGHPTVYARLGDWPIGALAVLLVVVALWRAKRTDNAR